MFETKVVSFRISHRKVHTLSNCEVTSIGSHLKNPNLLQNTLESQPRGQIQGHHHFSPTKYCNFAYLHYFDLDRPLRVKRGGRIKWVIPEDKKFVYETIKDIKQITGALDVCIQVNGNFTLAMVMYISCICSRCMYNYVHKISESKTSS